MWVPDMSQHPALSIELMASVTDMSLVGPHRRVCPVPGYTWSHSLICVHQRTLLILM